MVSRRLVLRKDAADAYGLHGKCSRKGISQIFRIDSFSISGAIGLLGCLGRQHLRNPDGRSITIVTANLKEKRGGLFRMRYKLRVTLTVTGLLSSFALHAQDKLQPFSADVTYEVNGEKQTGKIYSDGHSVRIESPGHLPDQEDVFP
jgi:hypothetical protein